MTNVTIALSKETKYKLARLGKFGQTYDDIINNILDKVEGKIWFDSKTFC